MTEKVANPDINTQRQFWEDWIESALERPSVSALKRGEMVLEIMRSFNLVKSNILEVGCANGWLSLRLSQFGRVTGVDLADNAIAAAKTLSQDIEFIAGDFQEVGLPNEHFDVVVSVDTISHVKNQSAFIDRIASLLKACGYLILIAQNKFVWERTDFIRRSSGEIVVNWPSMKSLKRLLRPRFLNNSCDNIRAGRAEGNPTVGELPQT